jgi:DNA-binding HxlR family transcriptional regulator
VEDRYRYSTDNCSVARTLQVVGEKWSLLILREAFYGATRFEDIHRRLGCARNLLSQRLDTLARHGVLARNAYEQLGMRTRYEYELTERGRKLYPVLVALMQWGDEFLADPAGPAVEVHHGDCGAPVRAGLRCALGHDLEADDAVAVPGPGAVVVA